MTTETETEAAVTLRRVQSLLQKPIHQMDRLLAGLTRGCEMLEQAADKYAIWDDEVRHALAGARALGWGGPPPPNMATSGGNATIAATPTDQCPICEMGTQLDTSALNISRWTCGHWIKHTEPAPPSPGPAPGTGCAGGPTGVVGRVAPVEDRIEKLELAVFGSKPDTDPNYPRAPKPPPSLMEMVHELWRFTGSGHDHQINKASLSTTIFEMVEARIALDREHEARIRERQTARGRLRDLLFSLAQRLYPRPDFRDPRSVFDDSIEEVVDDAGNGSLS